MVSPFFMFILNWFGTLPDERMTSGWRVSGNFLGKWTCTDIKHQWLVTESRYTLFWSCFRNFFYSVRGGVFFDTFHYFRSVHGAHIRWCSTCYVKNAERTTTNVTVWHQCRFCHQATSTEVWLSWNHKNSLHTYFAEFKALPPLLVDK